METHDANGYLPDQFMTLHTNGAPARNRVRLLVEVSQAVREKRSCSGVEFMPGNRSLMTFLPFFMRNSG